MFLNLKRNSRILAAFLAVLNLIVSGGLAFSDDRQPTDVSVHDPSILFSDGKYWVFGSHLQSAWSQDLVHWNQYSTGPEVGNPLIPNPAKEMAEGLRWAKTRTFWAPDVLKLKADGRYYMYYCMCKGDSPRSALGMAVSDRPEGPYTNLGLILRSGQEKEPSEDGKPYDGTRQPNTVDPNVFYDPEGNLWMVYGSYSGGIFVLKMDPQTGRPLAGQGYGRKISGGNHVRMEAPYMLYNPDTQYWYLFLSFGGLDSTGGYNLRVARAKTPEGPFLDPVGHDMVKAKGSPGSFFDDDAIQRYGLKIIGGYQFEKISKSKEPKPMGYLSPGHCSALHDPVSGRYFLFFHTRFVGMGENHELRVHELLFNHDGWPLVVPLRYTGSPAENVDKSSIPGTYRVIDHGTDISAEAKNSLELQFLADGKISGKKRGTWSVGESGDLIVQLGSSKWTGRILTVWNPENRREELTFSAASNSNSSLWGIRNP